MTMSQTLLEKLTATPEGMALFQQERLILEVTELICRMMKDQRVSKAELAERLGKSRAYVTQLLDGRANMTLRTVSDTLAALGHSLHVSASPLSIGTPLPEPEAEPVMLTYRAPDCLTDSIQVESTGTKVRVAKSRSLAAPFRLTA